MSLPLLLGLDVGTTAVKALLFDLQGRVRAGASYAYRLLMPQSGWVEQDAEELWRGVVTALRTVTAQRAPGDEVLALAQSSQGGTTIPVDAAGAPLCHAISWMDGRAQKEQQELREAGLAEMIYRRTGWPLMAGLPLQHIRWLRRERPALFAAARHFLFVNDFIGQRLTGELCMNPSDASITQPFDIEQGRRDAELLALAGIRGDQLSPIQPSGAPIGRLTAEASALTGLPAGLPVINGAHDQYCAAVGMGVTRPGAMLLSCGTAWVLLVVPPDLEAGRRAGLALSCHAVPGQWGAIRSLGAMGASLEWLADNVWADAGPDREARYAAINAAAAAAPAGANGLLFYGPAGGHAGPGVGRGGWAGLTLSHSRGDLARSVMEGVACEARWAIAEMRAAGIPVDELTMVGGAARSPIWPQIVADFTGISVIVPAMAQAASWGAAVIAGVGIGEFASIEEAGRQATGARQLHPTDRERCDAQFARYQALWQPMTQL
ncbi:MAG: FGGY family carbohydrate kinase [Anaerolineae bacterium]|nr:FGGY family carbohydrate kinase [Anaerolineae bacterium]